MMAELQAKQAEEQKQQVSAPEPQAASNPRALREELQETRNRRDGQRRRERRPATDEQPLLNKSDDEEEGKFETLAERAYAQRMVQDQRGDTLIGSFNENRTTYFIIGLSTLALIVIIFIALLFIK